MREYCCQLCGDTAVVGDLCPRCAVPMIDVDRANLVRIGARSLRNKMLQWYALAWVLMHAVVNIAINTVLRPTDGWGVGLVSILGSIFLSVALAGVVIALGRGGNVRAARRMERWPTSRPIESIGAAGDGPVVIRGRTRSGSVVFDAHGTRAVAGTRVRHKGPLSPSLITRATEFTIEDEAGERAIIRASEVVVIGGVEVDGEHLVPDGALVEIAGIGARKVGSDRDGGYRSDVRTLELSGDAKEPLVIRVVEVPARGTPASSSASNATGVRVAVDAPGDEAQGEDRDTEAKGAAEASAGS